MNLKLITVVVTALIGVATVILAMSVIGSLLTAGSDVSVALGFLTLAALVAVVTGIVMSRSNGRKAVVVALCGAALSGACTRVEPGWEGIKVDMLGGDRGKSYPIVTGRVYYNPYSEDIYAFPTFLQRVVWTAQEGEGDLEHDQSFTFRSQEGYAFNVDVGLGVRFNAGKTPETFVKYRRTAEEIIDGPFRDVVREAFVQVGSQMEGLSILGSGMTALNQQVTDLVRKQLADIATVEYVNVVGKPRVDQRVEQAINAVIQATQEANEAQERVRMREAEARQKVASANGEAEAMMALAKAKADSIKIEAEALRQYGTQVIEMRAIEKWNGILPQVTGGGGIPFINVAK